MKNVLVFPAGSEIGLEINNALKYSTHFRVFGLTSVENHAGCVFSDCLQIPQFYHDPEFIDALNQIVARYGIDYIYPADDDVQLFLVENQKRIHAAVISSELSTVEICRSKMRSYQYFSDEEFVPRTFCSPDCVANYPVFLKPDIGQGSEGALKVDNRAELDFALKEIPQRIICEYLGGEEYTVDCFSDQNGRLLDIKMRNRKRIRSGISVHSEILPLEPQAAQIAGTINSRLKFIGAWFFQVKRNRDGQLRLMEIAPRIAGTMGLSRNTGINYPLLTLFVFEGHRVDLIANHYQITVDRALISRYQTDIEYHTVYLDFDDTLIVRGGVNSLLMMFLYQAKNVGKTVVLLSRHRKDIEKSLEYYCIDRRLFDSIYILADDEKKSSYITEKNAVFIDDSFAERKEVSIIRGIPVFDCSEVEALLDWRVGTYEIRAPKKMEKITGGGR